VDGCYRPSHGSNPLETTFDTNHDDEEEEDDEDLDSILDSVWASDDDDDEEGAVRLQFDLLCLDSLPHRCTNLPSI
jgi:hypothetical protein